MIHVDPAPEPALFNQKVRQPGLAAIAELVGELPSHRRPGPRRYQAVVDGMPVTRREDIPPDLFPKFWQKEWLEELLTAYHRICAYICVYIEPITGAATIDHMIPKSTAWNCVYEWTNYRLACSIMNSRKRDMQDVLDPFDIEDGWFQIELTQFHVVANPDLDPELAGQVNTTISRLALNSRQCRELRMQYADDYWAGQITYAYLLRRAPFIAKELRRQNRLRFADA